MNFFEFYSLPVSFNPDQVLVKKKFYALSKEYHPDFYVNESEDEQKRILELSTLNNKAYQVLSNSQKTLAYILDLFGELEEGEKYQLPNTFLMEMMEVNEALMELEFDFDEAEFMKIKKNVEEIENNLESELKGLMSQYDDLEGDDRNDVLKSIKDIFYRKKYLLRIKESIHTFASRS